MRPERKLELLKRYDFSQHADGKPPSPIGFRGSYTISIAWSAKELLDPALSIKPRQELWQTMLSVYGYLRSRYDEIDFDELQKELETDEDRRDFSALFKTRDLLPRLGKAVYKMVMDPSNVSYQEIYQVIKDLQEADTPPYRRRIQELETQLRAAC